MPKQLLPNSLTSARIANPPQLGKRLTAPVIPVTRIGLFAPNAIRRCPLVAEPLLGGWVAIRSYFQRVLARVGLPRQRFHDLRHGCASLLIDQGMELKDIAETLGHSQISTTSDLYGHMYQELRQEVADRMDAVFAAPA
jgi:integrase